MASLKEIRTRITSVGSTMQITQAMKMVSAAKLKRAQDRITLMRPYAVKMQEILENLSQSLDVSENPFGAERDVKRVTLVVITSNRGLCGAFNSQITKEAKRLIREDFAGKEVTVIPLGKKARDAFKDTDHLVGEGVFPFNAEDIFNDLTFENSCEIADHLMTHFVSGAADEIRVVYNQFKNAAMQIIQNEQFLPIQAPETTGSASASSGEYIFEPDKLSIVSDLVPRSLRTQLFKALLDSNAAEHGARMTAMHKATDNADALRRELKLTYNKARQAAITNEILEIVGGAEALNG